MPGGPHEGEQLANTKQQWKDKRNVRGRAKRRAQEGGLS